MPKAVNNNSLETKTVSVKVTDINGKDVYKVQSGEPKADLKEIAEAIAKKYPDCFVGVYMNSENFCYLPPKNMDRDQGLVDSGMMTMEEFMEKWYPMAPKTKKKLRDEIEMLEEQEAFEGELY